MNYWNQQNFEGLKSIGEKYSSVSDFELFGKYCLLREKGLKKQSVVAINEFVSLIGKQSTKKQREIATELSALSFWNRDIHQLVSHPLKVFLKDVLEKWTEEDITDAVPYRWLGYISGDLSQYKKALEIDPTDEICITRLAQSLLDDVDYQTHHLSESKLLGEFSDAMKAVSDAETLINLLKNNSIKSSITEELNYYKELLASWQEYDKSEKNDSFPAWCTQKGEKYNFPSIVYYN